ncbi:glycosyltransferase family A protein, partial [Chamaesiphon sp. OTE_20_metabat_361]|uniref:glycosyltransferase family 2 protein n=1 Tax=Chamaesiphon sp. OTE_20_metabat_361 TaxID=2964689 RepID=UPI00286B4DCD
MEWSWVGTINCSVSVIIPSYNSGEFLPAAIESAIDQSYPASEIIAIDDGSTDDTRLVCARYPTVRYIYQSNQGLPGARNKGIEVATGEYLIFLDSDDYLCPEAIEIGVSCLQAHPEAGFVFGRYLFRSINPDGSYSTQRLFDEPPSVASYTTILAAQHNIQCATAICRREAVTAVGGFAPQQEDLNLWLRIAREWP